MKKKLICLLIACLLVLTSCEYFGDDFWNGILSDVAEEVSRAFIDITDEQSTPTYSRDENWRTRPFAVSKNLSTPPPTDERLFDLNTTLDYIVLNGNKPYFDTSSLLANDFMLLSEFDDLGRCGMAISCLSLNTMPTENRDSPRYNPTGWKSVQYDGKYLYNRSHLLGFQLTGDGSTPENLITGTRHFNTQSMIKLENQVASYIKKSGNHVTFRVTPVFYKNELVARGVIMEAYSVEDKGKGICFCVFVRNVQPGIIIDYATGESVQEEMSRTESKAA